MSDTNTTYEKTTWAAGDTVTATKMNHIEQGIKDAQDAANSAGGVFMIECEYENLQY